MQSRAPPFQLRVRTRTRRASEDVWHKRAIEPNEAKLRSQARAKSYQPRLSAKSIGQGYPPRPSAKAGGHPLSCSDEVEQTLSSSCSETSAARRLQFCLFHGGARDVSVRVDWEPQKKWQGRKPSTCNGIGMIRSRDRGSDVRSGRLRRNG